MKTLKNKRVLYGSVLAAGFSLSATSTAAQEAELNNEVFQQKKLKKPNILFIFSDDHALNAISAYDNSLCQTPNIDRIAKNGAVVLNNTCCNSISGPSRAAIMTGKHSHSNGFKTNLDSFDGKQQTFPKLLQKEGYKTAMIGKWHLKSNPTGFDYWDILPGQGYYYNPVFKSRNGRRKVKGYNTDIVGDLSLKWLKENQSEDKPFLLMCQFKAPHRNWCPALRHLDLYKDQTFPVPETFYEDYSKRPEYFRENEMRIADHLIPGYDLKLRHVLMFDKLGRGWGNSERLRMDCKQRFAWDKAYRSEINNFILNRPKGKELAEWKYQHYIKDYLRCIAAVDENVGRLLDYLEESGLDENTIIVYSSDQGFYLGEHGMYDKRWMYQESLSMPLIVSWKNRIEPGQRFEAVTQNIDFAPTFLEAAGAEIPEDIQGDSLVPLLTGNHGLERDGIYYHYYEKGEHNVPRHEGVYNGRYKLISFYDYDSWELYDIQNDSNELNNLYDSPEYAEVKDEMKKLLTKLKKQYSVK